MSRFLHGAALEYLRIRYAQVSTEGVTADDSDARTKEDRDFAWEFNELGLKKLWVYFRHVHGREPSIEPTIGGSPEFYRWHTRIALDRLEAKYSPDPITLARSKDEVWRPGWCDACGTTRFRCGHREEDAH
jgi:hypothetical protein